MWQQIRFFLLRQKKVELLLYTKNLFKTQFIPDCALGLAMSAKNTIEKSGFINGCKRDKKTVK